MPDKARRLDSANDIATGQIGFRFTLKKEPGPVVFIDHIDKPTPN